MTRPFLFPAELQDYPRPATGLTFAAAASARSRAVSTSSAVASATPMRRRANDSGLPNRRMSVSGTCKRFGHAFEGNAFRIELAVDHRRRTRRAQRRVDRQAQHRFGVQLEFALHLRRHRHHAGIVRTRAHFREPHHVALDEQLDAEHAVAAQVAGDLFRDLARALSASGAIGCGCQDST